MPISVVLHSSGCCRVGTHSFCSSQAGSAAPVKKKKKTITPDERRSCPSCSPSLALILLCSTSQIHPVPLRLLPERHHFICSNQMRCLHRLWYLLSLLAAAPL